MSASFLHTQIRVGTKPLLAKRQREWRKKLVTLKEIAQMCGVTPGTVSNVINGKPKVGEDTKRRILDAIEETGYQPNYFAQGMRKHKTRIIGIIAEDLIDFASISLIETVMTYCEANGYRTVHMNMHMYSKYGDTWFNDARILQAALRPMLQELRAIKVDGIIYIAGHSRYVDCFPEHMDTPCIMVYGLPKDPKIPTVVLNDEKGGYSVTKYLISAGHREIGIIQGKPDNIHTIERLKGIQKAMFEGKVPYNPEWNINGLWNREGGYTAAKKLLKNGVRCILCMNDLMAAGVYDYVYENGGKIGEDISVFGYDNREISAYMRPLLSTYDMHLTDIAAKASEMMIEQLEQPDFKWPERVIEKNEGELIIRDSVCVKNS